MSNFTTGLSHELQTAIIDQQYQSAGLFAALHGPSRAQTDAEWMKDLRRLNKPDPKFDDAWALERMSKIRAFLAMGDELGFGYDGYEAGGRSDAQDELEELQSKAFIGPRLEKRGRVYGRGLMSKIADDLLKPNPAFAAMRGNPDAEWKHERSFVDIVQSVNSGRNYE